MLSTQDSDRPAHRSFGASPGGGLSGFTCRTESEFDPFGAAHYLHVNVRRPWYRNRARPVGVRLQRHRGRRRRSTFGRHGLRGAEQRRRACTRLIIILNDNDMSIAPPSERCRSTCGDFARASPIARCAGWLGRCPHLPRFLERAPTRSRNTPVASSPAAPCSMSSASATSVRSTVTMWRTSPTVLETCARHLKAHLVLHVLTRKGKGYAPAEASADKYHGVVKFDVVTGKQAKAIQRPILHQGLRRGL